MRSLNEKLDRLMQEKQDADQFIRVIAPEYIAVYLINFAQDSFRKILIPDFFRDMLDKILIEVEDNGSGIAKEDPPRDAGIYPALHSPGGSGRV